MKNYEKPIVILLKLENEDILTVSSDPTADDLDWLSIEANSNLFH